MSEKHDDRMILLSRLLSVEDSDSLKENKLLELENLILTQLKPLIEEGSFLQKSKLLYELETLIRKIKFLSNFPFIIGKTVVGVMNGSHRASEEFYNDILNIDVFNGALQDNRSIPSILIDNPEKKFIYNNKYNHFGELDHEDIKTIFRDLLNRYKIDIRQFLASLCVDIHTGYSEAIFIDFPVHNLRYTEFNEDLIEACDVILINARGLSEWRKEIDSLYNKRYSKQVFIFQDGIAEEVEKYLESSKSINHKLDVTIKTFDEKSITELLKDYNIHRYNIDFDAYLYSVLLKLESHYKRTAERLNATFTELNKDIVLWEDDGEEIESAKQIRKGILVQQKKAEEYLARHSDVRRRLTKVINEIEEQYAGLYRKLNGRELLKTSKKDKHILNLWKEISISLIEIGQYEEALKYIQSLKENEYDKLYLINLYMSYRSGAEYEVLALNRLRETKKTDMDIIKAKIMYRDELGITDLEAGNLSSQLDFKETADEMYVYALYKKGIDTGEAIRYFRYAFEHGFSKAGDELMQILKVSGRVMRRDLEYLSGLLLPQANYELAKEFMAEERYVKAIIHFKVSGVMGHLGAISELANIYFNRGNLSRAIPLYEYAISKGLKDKLFIENLGTAYYATKDYHKAMQILKTVNSANANFLLGKMYDYGLGTPSDINRAKEFYLKAKGKGHSEAASNYEKVSARIEYTKEKPTYSSGGNYKSSSRTTSSSSSDSLCFLTTATCKALGKEDDCEELIAFKKYRDQHLIHDADGPGMLREYYKVAPIIVEKIEASGKSLEVYNYMWDKYISVGYGYLLSEDYVKAKTTYVSMVEELAGRYL